MPRSAACSAASRSDGRMPAMSNPNEQQQSSCNPRACVELPPQDAIATCVMNAGCSLESGFITNGWISVIGTCGRFFASSSPLQSPPPPPPPGCVHASSPSRSSSPPSPLLRSPYHQNNNGSIGVVLTGYALRLGASTSFLLSLPSRVGGAVDSLPPRPSAMSNSETGDGASLQFWPTCDTDVS